jgi:Ca2+-binding EF-hand superfamily protein
VSGDDGFERRLAALKRAVEGMASAAQKKKAGAESPVTLARALAQKPAKPGSEENADGAEGDDEALRGEGEEESSQEVEGEPAAAVPPLGAALARRRQLLEDIRARLRLLDTNADSQISLKEFDGDLNEFLHFDRNGSGRITPDEIQRGIAVEEEALNRVAGQDRDGDGKVSPSEFRGSPRRFRFLDENNDGAVSVEEYVAEHRRLSERMERDDINRDHKLAPAEFGGGPAKFEKYDANRDGFIDRSELKQMVLHGHD